MNVLKAIKKRRSVRSFLDKGIEESKISKILEAGSLAPSSGNVQNWEFIVVKNDKEEIAEACRQDFILEAAVLIIVCNTKNKIEILFGDKGKEFYGIQNCAMAIENMLLGATALGLGSCFVAVFDEERIKRTLSIPGDVSVDGVIVLGYAKGKSESDRISTKLKTFFERYGKRRKPSILKIFKK